MIDYLFISPLGWSKKVWNKLLKDKRFQEKSIDIIDFLNDSFDIISEDEINRRIKHRLSQLSKNGWVITSSYGTAALISCLKHHHLVVKQVLMIDGLDQMPSLEELKETFADLEDVTYQYLSDYYDEMLSDDEKNDTQLLEILTGNLIVHNGRYRPKLNTKNTLAYLSIYSNLDIAAELTTVLNQIEEICIFSSRPIGLAHRPISQEDHLLMLTEPQRVLEKIIDHD
ncbi:hypothetical protein [Streptococcus cuniculipharyngis]|uniref:Alpha/beta hydrolase n=1 Tax=Streptococcus cuniculipharyngis TaxID=1562651 RepID=A0A5C5SF07_9STRE|nr:hypothetical protein [Streptococcus cuniculipharyngis]TWS98688.1 hypothetical protein FRX57_00230 [Streptococcus cuniculipharyngis]